MIPVQSFWRATRVPAIAAGILRIILTTLACMLRGTALLMTCAAGMAEAQTPEPRRPLSADAQVKVFLDCQDCYADFLRTDLTFVDFVRDRTQADVHVLISSIATGSGGREYSAAFIGAGPFAGTDLALRAATTRSDPEDVIRRQLATTLRVGLLRYVTQDSVPAGLEVSVQPAAKNERAVPAVDRWNHWVYSLQGNASFEGEESTRQTSVGASLGADRITPNWKLTFGLAVDQESETFDLDEEEPVSVERRERDFEWLGVKALGEHWSIGAEGSVESSSFDNTRLSYDVAPAIEYNVFPYSAYTRRQLRALYSLGARRVEYYEQTVFGKTSETLPEQELSLTFEQREQWGTLESRVEWSQLLNDLSKSRLEVDGQVSLRVARGLSVAAEVSASRIRDQLSLPARGATPEEVLLRLRRLQSGYEYDVSMSLTYSFGSIFSSIVNPRFGR